MTKVFSFIYPFDWLHQRFLHNVANITAREFFTLPGKLFVICRRDITECLSHIYLE